MQKENNSESSKKSKYKSVASYFSSCKGNLKWKKGKTNHEQTAMPQKQYQKPDIQYKKCAAPSGSMWFTGILVSF